MIGSIFPTKGKYLVPKQPLLLASYKETAVIILYSSIRKEKQRYEKKLVGAREGGAMGEQRVGEKGVKTWRKLAAFMIFSRILKKKKKTCECQGWLSLILYSLSCDT